MPRYFLEVSYKGTNYSGFQSQLNTKKTIQFEIEKAFEILSKRKIQMTGSSRTDAGVHALQNFFHFDFSGDLAAHVIYKMNAILPDDIAVRKLIAVRSDAHCRFDALNREYKYFIYRRKQPFLRDRAFYFPYKLDVEAMQEAGQLIKEYHDFTSLSKRRTQVKTFVCSILESNWYPEEDRLVFCVKADRFLRGMVRALVATMLKIGRGKITVDEFREIIEQKDSRKASFAVPAHGLFLVGVNYPDDYFPTE